MGCLDAYIEAALSLAAYITYLEYCVRHGGNNTRIFKELTQRSAGPLWHVFKQVNKKLEVKRDFSSSFVELQDPDILSFLDQAVTFLGQAKHEKADLTSFNLQRVVEILANVSNKVFSNARFGFFEGVQKQKFSKEYQGLFRHAHGPNPPFIMASKYKGAVSFSKDESILYSKVRGAVLQLQPLIFWDRCPQHPDIEDGHCFIFDKEEKKAFSFKAIGYPCVRTVSEMNEYAVLASLLCEMQDGDPKLEILELGDFADIDF